MQRRLPLKTAIDRGADSQNRERPAMKEEVRDLTSGQQGGLAVVIALAILTDRHSLTSFNNSILNSFVPLQRYTRVFLLYKNPSVVILNSIWLDCKLDIANAKIERIRG